MASARLGQGLARCGLALCKGAYKAGAVASPAVNDGIGNAMSSKGRVLGGAPRRAMAFSVEVEYMEPRREDREEALQYMTKEEVEEIDDVPNLDKAIKEIDDYHRRINLANNLENRKFYIKPNQLRRQRRSQKIRNQKMRTVREMAQWTCYLEERGVPLPNLKF